MSLSKLDELFAQVRCARTISEACFALAPIFDQYSVVSLGLTRGSIFWRARHCGIDPWETISEMGAPPVDKTAVGRLNEANVPVLYTSVSEETALAEVNAALGCYIQLIGYRTLIGEVVRLAVVGEMMHVHKFGYIRLTGSDPNSTLASFINKKDLVSGRKLLYIDAFLHQLLSDPKARDRHYILSRAVAAMIYRDVEIDGIACPSVRDPLGYNVTLRPGVAEKKVHPSVCFQCRIDAVHEFGFAEYSVLREAERLDEFGRFVWESPLPADRRRFFNLTEQEYKVGMEHQGDPSAFMHVMRAHQ